MKFLHLADLHLGKRVNGFDMLEDQRFILEQIPDPLKNTASRPSSSRATSTTRRCRPPRPARCWTGS